MDSLINKDKKKLVDRLFIDLMSGGKNFMLPSNPVNVYNREEIESFKLTEMEILFKLYFTLNGKEIKTDYKLKDPNTKTEAVFFWIYYKVYGFDLEVEKICEKNPINYLFLIEPVFKYLLKQKIENSVNEIIFHEDRFTVSFNEEKIDILSLLDQELTEEQFQEFLLAISPFSKDLWEIKCREKF